MIPKMQPAPVDPREPYLCRKIFAIGEGKGPKKERTVAEFADQCRAHFRAHYVDEVDGSGWRARDALKTITLTAENGKESTIWLMPNGIAVQQDGCVWSAWETLERVARNKQYARWASFARGNWTLQVPSVAGVYPVVAREAELPSTIVFEATVDFAFRRLALIEGVVCDVTHYRPTARRSEWRGYWWSEPLPELLAPTIRDKE